MATNGRHSGESNIGAERDRARRVRGRAPGAPRKPPESAGRHRQLNPIFENSTQFALKCKLRVVTPRDPLIVRQPQSQSGANPRSLRRPGAAGPRIYHELGAPQFRTSEVRRAPLRSKAVRGPHRGRGRRKCAPGGWPVLRPWFGLRNRTRISRVWRRIFARAALGHTGGRIGGRTAQSGECRIAGKEQLQQQRQSLGTVRSLMGSIGVHRKTRLSLAVVPFELRAECAPAGPRGVHEGKRSSPENEPRADHPSLTKVRIRSYFLPSVSD
jgi:hypothetical protein